MQRTRITAVATMVAVLAALPTSAALAMDMPMPAAPAPGMTEPGAKAPDMTQVAIPKETAIALARSTFSIPAALGEPNIDLYISSYGDDPVWNLSWIPKEDAADRRTYRVTVGARDGLIRSFGFTGQQPGSMALNYTRESAQAIAEKWLAKLVPTMLKELELDAPPLSLYYSRGADLRHTFAWNRMKDGANFGGQGVSIGIDAVTGDLTSYHLTYDKEAKVKPPATIIPVEDAEKAFTNELLLQLGYRYITRPGTSEGEWRLVYSVQGNPMLDAETAEVTMNGQPYDVNALLPGERLAGPAQPWVKPAKPLSREEALALASKVTGLPADLAPNSFSSSEGSNPKPYLIYNLSWDMPAKDSKMAPGRYYNLSIDALTGLVTSYSSYGSDDYEAYKTEQPKLNEEGARKAIIDFVTAQRPDLVGSLRARVNPYKWGRYPWEPETGVDQHVRTDYDLNFVYLQDGLPVEDVSVSASVHLYTGQIISLHVHGLDLLAQGKSMPAAKGSLTHEQAVSALMEQYPVQPFWLVPFNANTEPSGVPQPNQPMRLYYQLAAMHGGLLDAFSGHAIDYAGRDLVLASTRPLDIKGHWAEREIELLLARGVFDPTGEKFNPGGQVNQGDAVRWLVLSRGLRPQYMASYAFEMAGNAATKAAAPYAQAALDSGILTPVELGESFDAEASMTRSEFALWAVRTMGYDKVAAMDAAIELHFADAGSIAAGHRNAVALLAGLDVIGSGDTASFRPADVLTRAEAAKMLYGVMVHSRANYAVPMPIYGK